MRPKKIPYNDPAKDFEDVFCKIVATGETALVKVNIQGKEYDFVIAIKKNISIVHEQPEK